MIGVMFVGALGVNATTIITGVQAMKNGIYQHQYGVTQHGIFQGSDMVSSDDIIFSGWDYRKQTISSCAISYCVIPKEVINDVSEVDNIKIYRGIWTNKDIPLEDSFNYYLIPKTIHEAIADIKEDIQTFKNFYNINTIIIIYLGSPSKAVKAEIKNYDYEHFLNLPITDVPSSILYAIAAIESSAHFVDFTPSETLDFSFLVDLAQKYKVQLSGRDGSTGQTMLKLVIAEMLKIRALHLDAWYSTNILGNHDGYILSLPDYSSTKISDKMLGIKQLLGYDDFEHLVTIDYLRKRNDSKESWDSIDFSGWLNTPMTLKLNWQGEDAMLSAPIILDIIRLIEFNERKHLPCGLQKQFGLFFKHPYGSEGLSLSEMYHNLISFYEPYI